MNAAPATTRPGPTPPRPMPRLGWLELVVASQTVLPALMYVPAALPYRTYTRMLAYMLPLIAWAFIAAKGRRAAGGRAYPPATCLALAAAWLVLSIANPWINTLASATCSVADVDLGPSCARRSGHRRPSATPASSSGC